MGDTKRVQRGKPAEHGTGTNGPRYSLARLRYEIGKAREAERLRFEGDLDRWMKLIGAGISGYQPEAYTMIDIALADLVRLRSAAPKIGVTLDGTPIHPGNFPKPSGRLVTDVQVPFNSLCCGARFRYTPQTKVWVKIGADSIAEWDPSNVATKWIGQALCSFSDDGDLSREVYLVPETQVSTSALDQLHAVVDAWEALPGGRRVGTRDVEKWLSASMKPTIDSIRWFLLRALPDGGTIPSPVLRDDNDVRDAALEEAANAAETAQVPGSLLRPGIAKIIRALKSKGAQ